MTHEDYQEMKEDIINEFKKKLRIEISKEHDWDGYTDLKVNLFLGEELISSDSVGLGRS